MSAPFISNYIAQTEALSINTASGLGGATLTVYSGTKPANANTALGGGNGALVSFSLPSAGSNTVTTSGTIIFGTIPNATASGTGTASFFRVVNGANTICDGDVGTSGADLILPTTTITSGITVGITSFIYTVVQ
jgi:hypothetical protein